MRSLRIPSRTPFRAAGILWTAFALPGVAQPGLYAGGGAHLTRLEMTSEESDKGLRGVAGIQYAGDNLAIVLQGAYAGFAGRGTLSSSTVPRSETRLVEAHLLPKFYLRRGDISAFFIGGGGPQWTMRETWTETDGAPGARATSTRLDGGFQFGFGVEAGISHALKVGLQPSYHVVYWNGRQEFEYASFVAYLML